MPFTVSHSVVAFLLIKPLRTQAVISALIIGCMVPDLVYYLPGMISALNTHSLAALFWFSLPVGILVYCVYHWLISPTLLLLLPESVIARLGLLSTAGRLPEVKWVAVATSILLGASSHIFLDLFTHRSSFAVQTLPILNSVILTIGGYKIVLYHLLQHLSSWIGLLLLCYLVVKRYKNSSPGLASALKINPVVKWGARLILVLLPSLAGLYFIVDNAEFLRIEHAVVLAIFQSGSVLLLLWVLLALSLSRFLDDILTVHNRVATIKS